MENSLQRRDSAILIAVETIAEVALATLPIHRRVRMEAVAPVGDAAGAGTLTSLRG